MSSKKEKELPASTPGFPFTGAAVSGILACDGVVALALPTAAKVLDLTCGALRTAPEAMPVEGDCARGERGARWGAEGPVAGVMGVFA